MRVLVVEPDEGVRALIRKALEPLGYPVSATGDPGEAHALIREFQDIGVVLSDYDLPGTNGVEFLESVRKSAPHVRGAVVSSLVGDSRIEEAALALGLARLQKPFSVSVLAGLVSKLASGDRAVGTSE